MIIENTLLISPAGNPAIRPVDANRSIEWLSGAFRIYLKTPLSWAASTVILAAAVMALGQVCPAWLAFTLSGTVGVVVLGKFMRVCQALDEGRDLITNAKANAYAGALWTLALLAAAMCLSLCIVLGLLGVNAEAFTLSDPAAVVEALGFKLVVMAFAALLMTIAMWLAPALVVLKGVTPLQAIQMSFFGTLKNSLPFFAYTGLAILMCVVAALPFFLGLLTAIPMLVCASYVAYKDIFTA